MKKPPPNVNYNFETAVPQEQLVSKYNLDKLKVDKWRRDNLEIGVDYMRTQTYPAYMTLSESGVEKFNREFLTENLDPIPFKEDKLGRGVLRVTSVPPINHRIVIGEDNKGIRHVIMVQTNKNFLPGMEVPTIRDANGMLYINGNLPRSRGRW